MTRRSLPILAAIAAALLAGLPSSAVRAQQVFLGDPVDSSGRPFPMMPGLPLLLPGNDGEFGTADDVHDPSYSGDMDLVVRVGTHWHSYSRRPDHCRHCRERDVRSRRPDAECGVHEVP